MTPEAFEKLPRELKVLLRKLELLEATMKEHETETCFACSDWLAQDSWQRCDEYQRVRKIKWKWAKQYDDTTLAMALGTWEETR